MSADGVAACADPGTDVEHANYQAVNPDGSPTQFQLLEGGNYDTGQGLVRYVGVYARSPYECQQYQEQTLDRKPWEEAYRKLKP